MDGVRMGGGGGGGGGSMWEGRTRCTSHYACYYNVPQWARFIAACASSAYSI